MAPDVALIGWRWDPGQNSESLHTTREDFQQSTRDAWHTELSFQVWYSSSYNITRYDTAEKAENYRRVSVIQMSYDRLVVLTLI